MKVLIYVEGPSDKAAMNALLEPLLNQKRAAGIEILFFDAPEGDKKTSVLMKVPKKAANILLNEPDSIVVALPDLYPRNKAFPHETFDELRRGLEANFERELRAKGAGDDARLRARFKVFCFKHDLESLVLAAEEALKSRLGIKSFGVPWARPVEDQDQDDPPRRVIERLFDRHGDRYKDTIDAPLILGDSQYLVIADRCPQCFKPFVEFLANLS